MILLIDNFDSFTWNLVDYLERTGETVKLIRNDISPDSYIDQPVSGIVLSPGPGKPSEAGYLMQIIHKYHTLVPMLGVCLGHQAIAEYFGGKIVKAPEPKHGKISEIECNIQHPLFHSLPPRFNVVRYHSLVAEAIYTPLQVIASANGIIMGISHINLPVYGVQFHPEAILTENGEKIIQNWVKICRQLVVE